jgi:hypothetical protein
MLQHDLNQFRFCVQWCVQMLRCGVQLFVVCSDVMSGRSSDGSVRACLFFVFGMLRKEQSISLSREVCRRIEEKFKQNHSSNMLKCIIRTSRAVLSSTLAVKSSLTDSFQSLNWSRDSALSVGDSATPSG